MTSTPAREAERTRLSQATVIDRALALADADGLDALTIRKLATDLGVTPMAIYWHFHSKEELLEGLAGQVWNEIDTPVDPALDWPAQLRGLMESLVRVLRAHRSASQLLASAEKMGSEAFLRVTETTLEVLRRAGFDPVRASEVARNALHFGITLVMSAPGFDPVLAEADHAEIQRQHRVRLALLPPDRYPRLVEAAEPMTSCDPADEDFHYEFGIDLFLAGVKAAAQDIDTRAGSRGRTGR
jgi:TetR/AcrR family tetracycline transcriptional repressor